MTLVIALPKEKLENCNLEMFKLVCSGINGPQCIIKRLVESCTLFLLGKQIIAALDFFSVTLLMMLVIISRESAGTAG